MADNINVYNDHMQVALELAKTAYDMGEVPVGAVIVRNNEIIATAHNECRTLSDPTAHAEMLAMKRASKLLGTDKLCDCVLLSTLEPCAMCTGAIVHYGVKSVIFGAYDKEFGCAFSKADLLTMLSPNIMCIGGVMETECSELIDSFFASLRSRE